MFKTTATRVTREPVDIELSDHQIHQIGRELSVTQLVQILKERMHKKVSERIISEDADLHSIGEGQPRAFVSICLESGNVTKRFARYVCGPREINSKISEAEANAVKAINDLKVMLNDDR